MSSTTTSNTHRCHKRFTDGFIIVPAHHGGGERDLKELVALEDLGDLEEHLLDNFTAHDLALQEALPAYGGGSLEGVQRGGGGMILAKVNTSNQK